MDMGQVREMGEKGGWGITLFISFHFVFSVVAFKIHTIAQANLKLAILLTQPLMGLQMCTIPSREKKCLYEMIAGTLGYQLCQHRKVQIGNP